MQSFKFKENSTDTNVRFSEFVEKDHFDLFKKISEHKLDPNTKDNEGKTLVHYAAAHDKLDLFEYFFNNKNTDFNALDNNEWTPLHYAASHGHLNAIEYLVNKKHVNINVKNKQGKTLLSLAFNNKIKSFLQEKQEELNMQLVNALKEKSGLDTIIKLMREGADLHDKNVMSVASTTGPRVCRDTKNQLIIKNFAPSIPNNLVNDFKEFSTLPITNQNDVLLLDNNNQAELTVNSTFGTSLFFTLLVNFLGVKINNVTQPVSTNLKSPSQQSFELNNVNEALQNLNKGIEKYEDAGYPSTYFDEVYRISLDNKLIQGNRSGLSR